MSAIDVVMVGVVAGLAAYGMASAQSQDLQRFRQGYRDEMIYQCYRVRSLASMENNRRDAFCRCIADGLMARIPEATPREYFGTPAVNELAQESAEDCSRAFRLKAE
jgi:hypothetical protein